VGETREERRNGRGALDRAEWLARPWFFFSVALLALNDHVFKHAFPGWFTGKLSDFTGLVVVATVTSVLLGARSGTVLAGVAFVALKTVPGVSEQVAPLLGGLTLRDPSDLVALATLPILLRVLTRRRADQLSRNRRGWAAVGFVAAVLATTATSSLPHDPGAEKIGFVDQAFYAQVYVRTPDWTSWTRWARSTDGGATWKRVAEPLSIPKADRTGEETGWQLCARDGVCYRSLDTRDAEGSLAERSVERLEPDGGWHAEPGLGGYGDSRGIAVNPDDSAQAVVASGGTVFYRSPDGTWREADLVMIAATPNALEAVDASVGSPGGALLFVILLGILAVLIAPGVAAKVCIGVPQLFVGALLWYASLFGSPGGTTTTYACYAGIVLAIACATRLASCALRRHARRAAPTHPDPPPGSLS
jgi:hypothetical protein